MTASIHFKGLLAGLAAVAIAGSAIAQSTPPNPAAKDPAVGAGQQSSQTTPMGSTGTPSGGSTAAGASGSSTTSGSTAASPSSSGSTAATPSSSGSTSMGASGSASTDTSASSSGSRTARADRN